MAPNELAEQEETHEMMRNDVQLPNECVACFCIFSFLSHAVDVVAAEKNSLLHANLCMLVADRAHTLHQHHHMLILMCSINFCHLQQE